MSGTDSPWKRAREFGLASLLASYPDQDFETSVEDFESLRPESDWGNKALELLSRYPDRDDLRSDYVDLFDRMKSKSPVYETEYGRMRGMAKGNDLADIAGFYAAFGFELDDAAAELPDHAAVELEFYSVLLMKEAYLTDRGELEGADIVHAARRSFLEAHLGAFLLGIAERQEVASSATYGPIFALTRELVERECRELGVEVAPLLPWEGSGEREGLECGASELTAQRSPPGASRLPVVDST